MSAPGEKCASLVLVSPGPNVGELTAYADNFSTSILVLNFILFMK